MSVVRKLMKLLRAELPTRWPVVIRRAPLRACYGSCDLVRAKRPYFAITLRTKLNQDTLLDTLVHEYAHALSWSFFTTQMHGREWGIAYARIYTMLDPDEVKPC